MVIATSGIVFAQVSETDEYLEFDSEKETISLPDKKFENKVIDLMSSTTLTANEAQKVVIEKTHNDKVLNQLQIITDLLREIRLNTSK